MKDLEKIIQENRLDFDSFEPTEGHFERFEEKLLAYNKKQKSFHIGYLLKTAVVAVLVVLSGLWVYDHFIFQATPKGIALSEISPEYSEVEMYYTHLVNQRYDEILSYEFMDSTQKEMLMHELTEMDSIYDNLKNDLKTNPTDERIINAMIQHYQLKVEVMNRILAQLQQAKTINQQKSINHESTEI